VLPNAHDAPIPGSELNINESVPIFVAEQLFIPKGRVLTRFGGVPRTSMPEASIDKNRKPQLWKNEIGFSNKGPSSPPTRNTMSAENSYQLQFGGFIAAAPNTGHDFRAFLFREDIRHSNLVLNKRFSAGRSLWSIGIFARNPQTA
jgi:hypothetical protein